MLVLSGVLLCTSMKANTFKKELANLARGSALVGNLATCANIVQTEIGLAKQLFPNWKEDSIIGLFLLLKTVVMSPGLLANAAIEGDRSLLTALLQGCDHGAAMGHAYFFSRQSFAVGGSVLEAALFNKINAWAKITYPDAPKTRRAVRIAAFIVMPFIIEVLAEFTYERLHEAGCVEKRVRIGADFGYEKLAPALVHLILEIIGHALMTTEKPVAPINVVEGLA